MALYDNLGDMRKPYNKEDVPFRKKDLVSREPFGQFTAWFEEASKTNGIIEANAMCLSTATKSGIPSSRYVLLKGYSKEGFTFYTNYDTRKGRELLENPNASLCFYWEPLRRSVRIDGRVERIPESASEEYFNSRPRDSQIAACVSCSSQPVIQSRDSLLSTVKKFEEKFKDGKVPRPANWGGFLVIPSQIEFWQGQTTRTHDRILFRKIGPDELFETGVPEKGEDGWVFERLSP